VGVVISDYTVERAERILPPYFTIIPVNVQKFTSYFIKTEFLYLLWEGSLGWSVNNIVRRAALGRKFVFNTGRASKLKEIIKNVQVAN
jgi:hypothetical protein